MATIGTQTTCPFVLGLGPSFRVNADLFAGVTRVMPKHAEQFLKNPKHTLALIGNGVMKVAALVRGAPEVLADFCNATNPSPSRGIIRRALSALRLNR